MNTVDTEFFESPFSDDELFPQLQDSNTVVENSSSTDLSDLPLEDFVDLDSLIQDLRESDMKNGDKVDDSFLDEILSNFSDQGSPAEVTQESENEFKQLLDSVNISCMDEVFLAPVNELHEVEEASVSKDSDYNEAVDILALLNEQYGVDHSSELSNKPRALKRKDSNVEHVISSKKLKTDTITDINVPSPTLSVSSSCSSLTSLVEEKKAVRRHKNNEASKVTRARRKERHQDLFTKKSELEVSNAQLKIKIELMQKEADMLRQVLVAKLSNVSN